MDYTRKTAFMFKTMLLTIIHHYLKATLALITFITILFIRDFAIIYITKERN